jgi:hypothetical protein
MAVATESRKRRKSMPKKRKSESIWLAAFLLVAGIVAAPVALRAASVLALSGPNALTFLYPYVEIVKNSTLRIPGSLANPAAEWLMYLQFPLYGLLMVAVLRARGFWIALNTVVFVHAAGIGLAYLLNWAQNPYLRP